MLALSSAAAAQTAPPPAGTIQGAVPRGERSPQPLTLSLSDAVQRGLAHNLGVLLEEQRVESAEGARWHALSGVLPDVSGSLSATREKINLAAFGFTAPGIPQLVGPFYLYDVRVRLSQPVVDLSAINESRAASKAVTAQKATYADTRNLVLAAVTNLYLVAVAERSRVEAAEANERTADTVHRLAVDQVAAGVVPRLDALRSDVELGNARQRLIVARNDLDKAKLALARAIGLPLGQAFNLADALPFVPEPTVDVESAAAAAYGSREDYKAAQARVAAAEDAARAAWQSRLPTLTVDADYGTIGNTFNSMLPTFAVGATVHVPIFNAGLTRARTLEANADLQSRRAEADELRAHIYYDVQASALDLAAASAQVGVAHDAVNVAEQALDQAEDRFKAGVANNLEVVQAQQALTTSRENYIASLYANSVAKAALARAMGIGEREFLQLLEGTISWPKSQ
jgi:outer membrane protein TolC